MKKRVVTKCVPYTVCKQVPVCETVKVSCTRSEMVKTPVCKQVPVQVAVDVTVRKPRYVPCKENCSGPGCGNPQCSNGPSHKSKTGACDSCSSGNCTKNECGPRCSAAAKCAGNCRTTPIRDFLGKLCASRLACDPCPDACAK